MISRRTTSFTRCITSRTVRADPGPLLALPTRPSACERTNRPITRFRSLTLAYFLSHSLMSYAAALTDRSSIDTGRKSSVSSSPSIGFSDSEITTYGAVVGPTALDTFGQTELRIANFATINNGGRSIDRRLDQNLMTFGDTITWITGGHTIKGGFDTVRNGATDGFTANRGNPRGPHYITPAGSTELAFARFLIGLPPNDARLRSEASRSRWMLPIGSMAFS